MSPQRRRVRLSYQWHHHHIRALKVVAFLRHLLHRMRGPVVVLWDHLRLHRGRGVQGTRRRAPRLHLKPLRAYALELNPNEGVWRRTKQRLVMGCPEDRFALQLAVLADLESCRRSLATLWSRIAHSGITL